MITSSEAPEFTNWLRSNGAEILAPTNPYELVRFRANGAVHIIYQRASGACTFGGKSKQALNAWRDGRHWSAGITKKPRTNMQKLRLALLERDGDACWFCGEPMPEDDMTAEHLVAHAKGGPDHHDNLVLAHERCNKVADNLPLKEKIDIHVRARLRKAGLGGTS
jgi:5-methylcytosine-specific restriction endonuclease McrA